MRMRYDRNDMLKTFLRCDAIEKVTEIPREEFPQISFGADSKDIFIESLKTLLIAHSNGEGDQLCFKKVNSKIQEISKK